MLARAASSLTEILPISFFSDSISAKVVRINLRVLTDELFRFFAFISFLLRVGHPDLYSFIQLYRQCSNFNNDDKIVFNKRFFYYYTIIVLISQQC